MNKKKLILHIGRHKSGTSSLQEFLHINTDKLNKLGYHYPLTGRANKVAHHSLAALLNPKLHKDIDLRIQSRFLKEIDSCHTVIVSSEAFQNVQNVNLVKSFFRDFDMQVVCYFREYLEYMQSSYAQLVHNSPYSKSFDAFIEESKLSYSTFYNRWLGISSAFSIRYFNRDFLVNNDIIDDFCAALNVDCSNFTRPEKERNTSIGGNLLYFKLLINKAGLHHKNQYKIFSDIASKSEQFRQKFFISKDDAYRYRSNNECNQFLLSNQIELQYRDFSNAPNFPIYDHLDEDINLIKHLEEFKPLKNIIKHDFKNDINVYQGA